MLTTVVGNYPKIPNRPHPARLRQAIARLDRGEITPKQLAQVADEVTIEVIQQQVEAGVDLITDGQIRWDDDQTYIMRQLANVEIGGLIRYFDTNTYYRQPHIVGPVSWQEPILVREYQFAVGHSSRPIKAVLTGPYTLASLSLNSHHGSQTDLMLALATALNQEARALANAGAPVIQINEPAIVHHKGDIGMFSEAMERLLDGIQSETALYTWFGNATGILEQLLALPVDTIGLDFASAPANWDALNEAPFEKKLGFGIIDARNTRLESLDQTAEAIRRVTAFVPAERLYVNPSCGLEYLPREEAAQKLKRMVDGVHHAQGAAA